MAGDGWRATERPPLSAMVVGELASVSRRPNLGYPWVRVDVRSTTEVTSSSETSSTASYHRSTSILCFCFANDQAPLTAGPIYQSVCSLISFFSDLNTCFKNLYIELGVSKLSELNFVGFIMKCTI